jgi:hypothetical protein
MNPRKWQPTELQCRALTYVQEHGYNYRVRDLCRDVGLHYTTYYGWFDTEQFRAWWAGSVERWAVMHTARVYGAIFAGATNPDGKRRGSPAMARLWLKRFDPGYAPRTRRDNNADLPARQARMTDEDRRKLAVVLWEAIQDELATPIEGAPAALPSLPAGGRRE